MRGLSATRASTVVAVVAAIVAVLAVTAFPGVGIGDPTTSHGGSPTDVFMSTDPGVCPIDKVQTEPVSLGPTEVGVGQESHVLAYFTSKWSWGRTPIETELVWTLQILDGDGFFESSPADGFTFHVSRGHSTATVMWAFQDIPPGDYTVQATAQVAAGAQVLGAGQGATLQGCALTVFLVPAAG